MSTAEGNVRNVSVKNIVQTIVQHLDFRQTINLILTTTNQEQLTYIVGASIHPAFIGNCPTISYKC